MNLKIFKSKLDGNFNVPSSKSHSLRGIVLGCFASSVSVLKNVLNSDDIKTALEIFENLGCKFKIKNKTEATFDLEIMPPKNGLVHFIENSTENNFKIDCGNSGTLLYFLSVIFSFCKNKTFIFLGDTSLSHRPLMPILEIYKKRNLKFVSEENYLPLKITGQKPNKFTELFLDGEFSQSISALFLATAIFNFHLFLKLKKVGEAPYLSMTKAWLESLNFKFKTFDIKNKTFELIALEKNLEGFVKNILTDWSSVIFPVLAALSTKSQLKIQANSDPTQGDMKLLHFLKNFNCNFTFDGKILVINNEQKLKATCLDISKTPDLLPALCGIATLAEGTSEIKNTKIARFKETDRVKTSCSELTKLGGVLLDSGDNIIINGKKSLIPKYASVESYGDHRIAMMLSAIILGCDFPVVLKDYECHKISFPSFLTELKKCGGKFEICD